jgi:hypothetical protein
MISTEFIHVKKGWPVVISTGIGGSSWSVYLRKPSGRALQRCKQFGEHLSAQDAMRELEDYTGRALVRGAG